MFFEQLNSNFKIPKINHNVDSSKAKTHPTINVTQVDMFRIFSNLTILFVGDAQIRTLFRDFVKFFSNGHLLLTTEAAIQHGEYKELPGEQRLQKGGQRGTSNYRDVRSYFCEKSSTKLIYIHLPTVHGETPSINLNFLNTIPECTRIDAIIFALYHGDLNFSKLSKSSLSFDEILKNYESNFNRTCSQLIELCKDKKVNHQQKIWMSPYPPRMPLTNEQENQLKQIIYHTNSILFQYGFHTFDRHLVWNKSHEELLMPNSHYFSPKGIRVLTQCLAEIIGRRWNRRLTIPEKIPMTPTPLKYLDQGNGTDRFVRYKWPSKSKTLKHRFNPIDFNKNK